MPDNLVRKPGMEWLLGIPLLLWPLCSVLGVQAVALHILAFTWFFLVWREGPLPMPAIAWLAGFCAVYAASLVFLAAGPSSRMVASFYNLSFWMMGLLLLVLVYGMNSRRILWVLSVSGAGLLLSIGLAALALVVLVPADVIDVSWPTAVGALLSSAQAFPGDRLLLWLPDAAGWQRRLSVFAAYPNELAQMVVVLWLLSLITIRNGALRIAWTIMAACLVLMTRSRLMMVEILLLAVALPVLCLVDTPRARQRLGLALCLLLAVLLLLFGRECQNALEWFNALREKSSSMRLLIYQETWDLYVHDARTILLGLGIKPHDFSLYAPVGSHSTYLGVLLRAGLVGGVLLGMYLVSVTRAVSRLLLVRAWRPDEVLPVLVAGLAWISMLLYLAFEDIDYPPLLAWLFFILGGVILSLERDRAALAAEVGS